MNIIWSEEAALSLLQLESSLYDRFPRHAEGIVNALLRRVELLAENPRLGRLVPEYGHEAIRELVDSHNRCLYWLREDHIEILAVVPTRQPLPLSVLESDD